MGTRTQERFNRRFAEAMAPMERTNVVHLFDGRDMRQATIAKDVWEWEFLLRYWARDDQPDIVREFAADMRARLEHPSARLTSDDCPAGGMPRPS